MDAIHVDFHVRQTVWLVIMEYAVNVKLAFIFTRKQ